MIYRSDNRDNYTKVNNNILKNKNLSLSAKCLLITMLSLPENWNYSTLGLSSIVKESKNTIHRLLKELENNNYLVRTSIRDSKGRFIKYNYIIYEEPYPNNRDMDYPDMDICDNNKLNNNILSNNKDKNDKTLISDFTKELIKRKLITENDFDIVKYNDLFNELLNSYDIESIYIVANYVVKNIKLNKFKDEDNNEIQDLFNYFKVSMIMNLNRFTSDYEPLYPED